MIKSATLTCPFGEYKFNGTWTGDGDILSALNIFCDNDGEVGNPSVVCGNKAMAMFGGEMKYEDDGNPEDEEVKY